MRNISEILVILCGLLLLSCESDPVAPDNQDNQLNTVGIIIANEGNFLGGNASISYLDTENMSMSHNLFNSANGSDLGDVAHSLLVNDSICYIVVNNSHKIEVVKTGSFESIATIDIANAASPRNMILVDNNRAYVTTLFGNAVSIVDLQQNREIGQIPVGANPEELLIKGQLVFVTNSGFGGGNTVSVISAASDLVIDTLTVGDGPSFISETENGLLHVLCTGAFDFANPANDTPGGIWVIDPAVPAVVDSLVMAAGPHPAELATTDAGRGYFLYNGAVLEYNTTSLAIVNDSLVTGNYYHLSVDEDSERLYLLDAVDFTTPGRVDVLTLSGSLLYSRTTGIIPGDIAIIKG